eukprot:4211925-Pyramimonas_sp.AAC.1
MANQGLNGQLYGVEFRALDPTVVRARTSGGLVQEDRLGRSDGGEREGEPPLHPPRELLHQSGCVSAEAESVQHVGGVLSRLHEAGPLEDSVEPQVLLRRQFLENDVVLRAHPRWTQEG